MKIKLHSRVNPVAYSQIFRRVSEKLNVGNRIELDIKCLFSPLPSEKIRLSFSRHFFYENINAIVCSKHLFFLGKPVVLSSR